MINTTMKLNAIYLQVLCSYLRIFILFRIYNVYSQLLNLKLVLLVLYSEYFMMFQCYDIPNELVVVIANALRVEIQFNC